MLKNIGSTWFLNLLQMVVMLVLSPFILRKIGAEENGLWVTIVSFTGILGLFIVGVPMASVRFVAEQVAKKDLKATHAAISTCLGITTGLGIFALLVGASLWFVFNAKYLSNPATVALGATAVGDAQIAFVLVVIQVAFAFSMRLPYGIFDAHNDFVAKNIVLAGELFLRLTLTLLFLTWNATLISLALVQFFCMITEFLVAVTVLKRRHQGVAFSYARFDRSQIRRILSFSIYVMLLNVGLLIAFRIDALVIGAYMGPIDVIRFDFGNKFLNPSQGS